MTTIALAFFAVSLGLAVGLNALNLRAFFLYDDLPLIVTTSPGSGHSWLGLLAMRENGFWRPIHLLLGRAVIGLFGLQPLAFHLVSLVTHAAAAALAGLVALRLFRMGLGWATCVAALVATSVAAFPATVIFAHSCDPLATIGLLAGLLAWDAWLSAPRAPHLVALLCSFLFAVMSKEIGIVFPGLIGLWTVARGGPWPRRVFTALLAVLALAGAFGVLTIIGQQGAQTYEAAGRLSLAPKSVIRQLLDLWVSSAVPWLHIVEWPLVHLTFSHPTLWAIRAAALGLIILTVAIASRSPRWRFLGFAVLGGLICLAPASIVADPPQGRFVYPAVPFTCLALVELARQTSGMWRGAVLTIISALWLLSALSFFASPTVIGYRQTAHRVERFVEEIRRVAPAWKRGSRIAIFEHPHPGPTPERWVYGQLLFNIFIPEAEANLALEEIWPGTRHAYRFDGERLVEIPLAARAESEADHARDIDGGANLASPRSATRSGKTSQQR